MTRKDYVLIAAELRRSNPGTIPTDAPYDVETLARKEGRSVGFALATEAVARALSMDNPRFDRERFYSAVYDA